MDEGSSESPRRTPRRRNKPKKYGDFLDLTPNKRRIQKLVESSEEDDIFEGENPLKPTALFDNDDVKGQDIFKFKSRHTKSDLQNKVKAALDNSPRVLISPIIMSSQKKKALTPLKLRITPKFEHKVVRTLFDNDDVQDQDKSRHPKSDLQNKVKASPSSSPRVLRSPRVSAKQALNALKLQITPKKVEDKVVKKIIRELEKDSEESDFSGDSSDFIPEEESDNETESSASVSVSDVEEEKPSKSASQMMKIKESKIKPKDSEYFVTPDNYFMMHSSKKITTSDHTLAKLANLSLSEANNDYEAISEEHKTKIFELNQSYKQLFNKWLFVLNENFSIILYGLGSKRSILEQFRMEKLKESPVVVVNGFFPSLTIKNILEHVVVDLLEHSHVPTNIGDVVTLIDTQLTEDDVDLYLIIHNIDGIMLRNTKAQATLASLSQIKRVHTIASIDHINAPMLWDHSKLSKFKFTWWDVTTFAPYTEETSYENSLMSKPSGALQLSSLRSVYQSLTTNAKGILDIIIQYQLENHKQSHYQGLPFKDWYSKSRDKFLVSSVVPLRAHLTEFLDHKIVKLKTVEGSENYVIPIENSLLQQFLDMIKN